METETSLLKSLKSLSVDDPFLEMLKPSSLAVDVTNMCNLHCKHCFWVRDKHLYPTERQDVLETVKKLLKKFPSITNILWYGGEPLLNETTKNILVEGFKLLKRNNVVITNGTIPLPAYKENGVKYGISIDGTEELHDQMRGKNVYKKIKKNIKEGLAKGIDISINFCINSQNISCIPDFLEEWHKTGINKIYFTMYVPEKDDTSGLELSNKQMEESSLLLMEMKKKYSIVGNSYKMIELLHPKYSKELAENCFMNVNLSSESKSVTTLHLAYDGTIKTPCTYGTDETCEKCRSITHVALYASKVLKDRESLYMLLDGYHKTSK
jgi:MoaA/NifB/PqqE/SkfB family radical SAM enzyme